MAWLGVPEHTAEPLLLPTCLNVLFVCVCVCVSISWSGFAAGWTIGGLSGAGFAYILTQVRIRCQRQSGQALLISDAKEGACQTGRGVRPTGDPMGADSLVLNPLMYAVSAAT